MCKGYGYHQTQCPNRFEGFFNKQDLKKVYTPNDVMVLEAKNDLEDQVNELD